MIYLMHPPAGTCDSEIIVDTTGDPFVWLFRRSFDHPNRHVDRFRYPGQRAFDWCVSYEIKLVQHASSAWEVHFPDDNGHMETLFRTAFSDRIFDDDA